MKIKKSYILILTLLSLTMFIFLTSCSTASTITSSNDKVISDYKTFYNVVKESMFNYDSTLTVNIKNYDKNTYNIAVVKKILQDNIELRDNLSKYNLKVSQSILGSKLTFNFIYTQNKATIQARKQTVQAKVNEIVAKVTNKTMKDYEKEAALHDYIVNNTKYDNRYETGNMPKESYTAYGVFINGIGVCQGYAEAMYMLLNAAGIDSIIITGEADNGSGWIGHAWNLIKLEGQYYHLDTTWDDPVTKDGSNRILYSYFNVTDDQISKNHKWTKTNYPSCTAATYAFTNLNLVETDSDGNTIIVTKDSNEFINAVEKALNSGKEKASFKILNFNDNVENISNWIRNAYKETSTYGSYKMVYHKDAVWASEYVTIEFK